MHSGTIKSDYYLARLVASLLMASCFLSGCATPGSTEDAANAEALVAITAAPTNVYHQGKFVWHDLITPDIAASRKFYSGLFDWTFLQQGRYTIILNKGHRIGGMLEVKPQTGKEAEAVRLALPITHKS